MSERFPLAILGAGGHAKVVADVALATGRWSIHGFYDDRPELEGTSCYGSTVIGGRQRLIDDAAAGLVTWAFVAIGDNDTRANVGLELLDNGVELATLVDPRAIVSPTAQIGFGTLVMPGCVINADAQIGSHVIINTAARVDHDCVIADGCHVAPGSVLCGAVHVEAHAFLGAGTIVCPGQRIGAGARCGAGAVITRPVPPGRTAVGVPARVLP